MVGNFIGKTPASSSNRTGYQIVTPSAVGYLNELSKLAPEDADRAIEVVADYSSHPGGAPVKWCVGHWTEPKDFRERPRAGFTAVSVRAMACSTDLRLEVPTGSPSKR